jgi:N-formylglutamate deformylase
MDEAFPFAYDTVRAARVQPTVRQMICAALDALATLPPIAA